MDGPGELPGAGWAREAARGQGRGEVADGGKVLPKGHGLAEQAREAWTPAQTQPPLPIFRCAAFPVRVGRWAGGHDWRPQEGRRARGAGRGVGIPGRGRGTRYRAAGEAVAGMMPMETDGEEWGAAGA